jgi:hypothetical protein
MSRKSYPSDLSETEWMLVAPLIPPAKKGGCPRRVEMREILNALFYIDHDFADAGEQITLGSHPFTATGDYLYTQTVRVPSTIPLGETIMRVIIRYSNPPLACGSYSYGETEDYTILIDTSPPSYLLWTK